MEMKQNLILLHGALGSRDQFHELKELLSEQFDVYDLNFSGHGGSAVAGTFSIDLFVKDTLDFLDSLHLASAHFFGYSMGGYVALKLARDYPERVQKIITLGTKFKWDPESAAKDVRMMNPEVIEQKVPAYAATLAARHHPSDWKTIMTRTGEMMTGLGAGNAMTTTDFAVIANPVLVCIGTEDHMVSIAESEDTARQLRNGSLKIIEGFRHPVEGVDKNKLAAICKEFLG
jgi:pimeloyl-ACP methyl ester carboxylesterase